MRNSIYWVEIPAKDFERAKMFYETIFSIEMKLVPISRGKYAIFPLDKSAKGAGGAIVEGNGYEPAEKSTKGPVIYLDREEDLSIPLSKVEKAGGKILMPKTKNNDNPDSGYIAQFIDSEGNRMGLHSLN
jgi:uncharacterized protein